MKRQAMIIINPGEYGADNYCEGVNKDGDLYQRFLSSSIGGLWNSAEIIFLESPELWKVQSGIAAMMSADYSMAVFCGHGYTDHNDSSIIELKRDIEIPATELRRGAPKHTVILDCCRIRTPKTRMLVEARKMAKAAPKLYPSLCREYYDEYLTKCPPGLVVLQACRSGETAGDDSERGGFYSYSLLSHIQNWSETFEAAPSDYEIISVIKAHDDISNSVSRISGGRQHPEIIKPRSSPYFPLGIVA
ncbi:MAG TPA: caspase family protein [Stellaceae bacterium]|nr:caspase family protein [Stellaceae bacterium]